jgi:YgiT-type zinc finger domain-containing protein
MKCGVCGGKLTTARTDLPFKVNENTIVIVEDLPVFQCARGKNL